MSKDPVQTSKASCGIVMPISGFGDYDSKHWSEVREIIDRGISLTNYQPAPVWEHSETDIIHGRIVRNLYDLPIVVCDISGLNPNVMFELGMRLAFAKPTVVVVDDSTKIPFDTTAIEHIIYDRTLHYKSAENFVIRLFDQIRKVSKAVEVKKYQSFLDTFGAFATFSPKGESSNINDHFLRVLESITEQISIIRNENRMLRNEISHNVIYSDTKRYSEASSGNRNALMGLASIPPGTGGGAFWNEDKENRLREMWDRGLSASQIAEEFGSVSRNAVIGKAHKLGLRSQPSNIDQD